jgi:hypothetical protein
MSPLLASAIKLPACPAAVEYSTGADGAARRCGRVTIRQFVAEIPQFASLPVPHRVFSVILSTWNC